MYSTLFLLILRLRFSFMFLFYFATSVIVKLSTPAASRLKEPKSVLLKSRAFSLSCAFLTLPFTSATMLSAYPWFYALLGEFLVSGAP